MTAYAALLRSVNVGGTGKLPMKDLVAICEAEGFAKIRTYIASGNVVFETRVGEARVREALERWLEQYAGKPVAVHVRTAAELAAVRDANPFRDAPPERTVAIFLHEKPPRDALSNLKRQAGERLALGAREIYVHYPDGQGQSRLEIPAAKLGTARNMNTVAKLAEMLAPS